MLQQAAVKRIALFNNHLSSCRLSKQNKVTAAFHCKYMKFMKSTIKLNMVKRFLWWQIQNNHWMKIRHQIHWSLCTKKWKWKQLQILTHAVTVRQYRLVGLWNQVTSISCWWMLNIVFWYTVARVECSEVCVYLYAGYDICVKWVIRTFSSFSWAAVTQQPLDSKINQSDVNRKAKNMKNIFPFLIFVVNSRWNSSFQQYVLDLPFWKLMWRVNDWTTTF